MRPLAPLGTRQVAIMDRQQATPLEQPLAGQLPQTATQAAPAVAAWQAHIDQQRALRTMRLKEAENAHIAWDNYYKAQAAAKSVKEE